jgi:hypothetical protein
MESFDVLLPAEFSHICLLNDSAFATADGDCNYLKTGLFLLLVDSLRQKTLIHITC